jgi:hypothetical protein
MLFEEFTDPIMPKRQLPAPQPDDQDPGIKSSRH